MLIRLTLKNRTAIFMAYLKFAHGVCNCLHELPVVCVFHGQLIDSEKWSLHLWLQACELRALSCANSSFMNNPGATWWMKTKHFAVFFVNILVARPSFLNMLLVESRPWNCFLSCMWDKLCCCGLPMLESSWDFVERSYNSNSHDFTCWLHCYNMSHVKWLIAL